MINGSLDQHRCLLGTCVKKLKLLENFKIHFVMPEDIAITLSKSDVDLCSHGRDTDCQKVWTDNFSALYYNSRSCKY